MAPEQTKRAKGTVGEGAAGKKSKTTQHVGGQCVSEKSQVTRTFLLTKMIRGSLSLIYQVQNA